MLFFNDFACLRTREHLLTLLGIEESFFEAVLGFEPPPPRPVVPLPVETMSVLSLPLFIRHDIPKKNKKRGYRTVWEPFFKNEYKALARRLQSYLKVRLAGYPHPRAFGFVGGKNIRENARDHCGHRNLLCLDIRDFFPSITRQRVERLFLEAGMAAEIADLLSRFVCIGGSIPLGLPTSPTISNAIFLAADADLLAAAEAHDATYSRYADDLAFSGQGSLPALSHVSTILSRHGFEIAQEKTRRSKLGQAHYVTGLSVSDPSGPHVPKEMKRRLRQELHYVEKHGLDDHFRHRGTNDAEVIQREINRLDGQVKFVSYHEPRVRSGLRDLWQTLLEKNGAKPSYSPKHHGRIPFVAFVDESEFKRGDETFLALAMSVSQHQDRIEIAARETLDAFLSDTFADGDVEAIHARGLHFVDATEDLRRAYVERLQAMPFEGYVVMGRLESAGAYEETYLRLIGAIIRRRLMAAESQLACFLFEQNDKVSRENIRALIEAEWQKLRAEKNRHPKIIAVDFVSKPSLGTSVPDFLLGLLGKYLRSGSQRTKANVFPRDVLQFERLRDKYRLILDVDTNTEYSRRRPIPPW